MQITIFSRNRRSANWAPSAMRQQSAGAEVPYPPQRKLSRSPMCHPITFLFCVTTWLCFFFFFFFFLLFRVAPWHMEIPRLEVKSELQLPAYITTTATQDPSHVFNLHRNSRQHQILNPLNEARDRTHILMDTGLIRFCYATIGTPRYLCS